MNTQQTLENAIGKTIRVCMKGNQTPPCPPNGYLGVLMSVETNQITVNCKFGYTQQEKKLEFDGKESKITKILIEESQKIIYER